MSGAYEHCSLIARSAEAHYWKESAMMQAWMHGSMMKWRGNSAMMNTKLAKKKVAKKKADKTAAPG